MVAPLAPGACAILGRQAAGPTGDYKSNMTSPRHLLTQLIECRAIPPAKIADALAVTGVSPDAHAWRAFVDRLLLWVGALALAFAVLFFVAYNWSAIDRFAKFGAVQIAIVLAVVVYWKVGADTLMGKVSLLAATILLGVLLALYGQTYQTGADPWQLFFTWSMLMLPWAMVGRFAAIWLLWIALINLSIVLYYQTFGGMLWLAIFGGTEMYWFLFLFNTLALAVWEALSLRRPWLAPRWAPRLVALGSGVPITLLMLFVIFADETVDVLTGLTWVTWLAGGYFVYRKLKPDLFMLAGGCLSSIVVLVALLAEILNGADAGGYLFIAMVVIGLGAGSAMWLKRVHRQLQA